MQFECDFDKFPNKWTLFAVVLFLFCFFFKSKSENLNYSTQNLPDHKKFTLRYWVENIPLDCFAPLYWFDWKLRVIISMGKVSRFPILNALSETMVRGFLWDTLIHFQIVS